MFNTMTFVKVAGALIGSLLALLLLFSVSNALYGLGSEEGEGEEVAQAYTIPVESSGSDTGEETEKVQIDFAALLAAADPAKGEKVFSKCKACHKVDNKNSIGPHLNGVVGRNVASISDFKYSDAMVKHATEAPVWTPEAIQEFIENPKADVPGTKMAFQGLPKPEDRADVIAYLQSLQ